MAPWWWFPCKPKHVGAFLLILKYFNNLRFLTLCASIGNYSVGWISKLVFSLSTSLSPSMNRKSRLFSLRIMSKFKSRENMTLVVWKLVLKYVRKSSALDLLIFSKIPVKWSSCVKEIRISTQLHNEAWRRTFVNTVMNRRVPQIWQISY